MITLIANMVGVARSLVGLALIRAGGRIAGVPGRDTRVSLPDLDAVPVVPVSLPLEAQALIAQPRARRPLQNLYPPPHPGTLADVVARARRGV